MPKYLIELKTPAYQSDEDYLVEIGTYKTTLTLEAKSEEEALDDYVHQLSNEERNALKWELEKIELQPYFSVESELDNMESRVIGVLSDGDEEE